jgi:Ca2+-binding EF-hand superfamily protein
MFLIVISQCDYDDVKKSTEIFEKFDLNKNNLLEKSELKKCFQEIGLSFGSDGESSGFEDLFSVLDLDNSGYLNKIEFYMMIEGLRRQVSKKQGTTTNQ